MSVCASESKIGINNNAYQRVHLSGHCSVFCEVFSILCQNKSTLIYHCVNKLLFFFSDTPHTKMYKPIPSTIAFSSEKLNKITVYLSS